jgi:molybdenum cofactor cytidylyltransferase
MKTAVVLLAAGASTRLGRPKQLVSYGGRSLLRHAAETACAAIADQVVFVLGHEATRMREELHGLRGRIVENREWTSGVSSSVRAALASLGPDIEAVLLMVCDQPAVTTPHLDALIRALPQAGVCPVASSYSGTIGVPAIFPRALFGELMSLSGDAGAKRILEARLPSVTLIPLHGGEIDIDSDADLPRSKPDPG